MEPEYELALKVSSYIELLWDRAKLQAALEQRSAIPLADLFSSERASAIAEAIKKNPALLRKAVDVLSLYRDRHDSRLNDASDLVARRDRQGPKRLELRLISADISIQELAGKAADVLLHDIPRNLGPESSSSLRGLMQFTISLEMPVDGASTKVSGASAQSVQDRMPLPSIGTIRNGLAHRFYDEPELAADVADSIDYFPAFTVQLAWEVYTVLQNISAWNPAWYSLGRIWIGIAERLKGWFLRIWRSDTRKRERPEVAALRALDEIWRDVNVANQWSTSVVRDPRDLFEAFCWFFAEYHETSAQQNDILRSLCVFLLRRPRLGYFLARYLQVAVPFGIALGEELDEIEQSRIARMSRPSPRVLVEWRDPYSFARDAETSGICLSGGGIRSATFNLGVLQGLADLGMLRHFDYLSTVSGGGYIGAWLASWAYRAGSINVVEGLLSPRRTANPLGDDVRAIRWLREYSHYLTPHSGAFTTDTLTMLAVYFRNVVLNQVVLFSLFCALLLFPPLWLPVFNLAKNSEWNVRILVVLLLLASVFIGVCLRDFKFQGRPGKFDRERHGTGFIRWLIIMPIFLASFLAAFALWNSRLQSGNKWTLPVTATATGLGLLIAHLVGSWNPPRIRLWSVGYALRIALPAVFGGWLMTQIGRVFETLSIDTQSADWAVLVFGPPLVLAAWSATIIAYLGVVGVRLGDERREWWARLGAVIGIWGAVYLLLAAVAIYGPLLVWRSTYLNISLASIWTVLTALGLKFGAGPTTGPNRDKSTAGLVREIVAAVAPFVFIAGLFLILSFAVFLATLKFPGAAERTHLFQQYWGTMAALNSARYFLFLKLALAGAFLGFTVGVNEFSMHNFYKNRLIRAYIGASRARKDRHPNPFTGFDTGDDIKLTEFRVNAPHRFDDMEATPKPGSKPSTPVQPPDYELPPSYAGPFPILNAALNVTKGQDLALQERKAESFTFTPLRCGFHYTRPRTDKPALLSREYAYRRTGSYAYNGGPSIGTAVAISGAAANPNWGYHTNPATSFLLTMFNVRLGWWMGNPAGPKWKFASPRVGLFYLLANLTGSASADSNYVSLSDGGHFDNSGLYELVRRRCRYIMICDAEQDGEFGFGALGNAIRKCRVDFGAEVRLDVRNLIPVQGAQSKCHCAAGDVIYPDGTQGLVLYLKSSLDGSEPTDIIEYRGRAPDFPHQTTADQFFSESQFESYRMLGYHALLGTWTPAENPSLPVTFQSFGSIWPRPSSVQTDLRPYYDRVLSANSWLNAGPLTDSIARQRIALTYRIYVELKLRTERHRVVNKGIISILSTWKRDAGQGPAWQTVAAEYEAQFAAFYDWL